MFTVAMFLGAYAGLPNSDQGAAPSGMVLWVGSKSTGPNGVYVFGNTVTWGGNCVNGMGFCLEFLKAPNSSSDYISVNKDLTTTIYVNKSGHENISSIISDGSFAPPADMYVYPQILSDQKVDVSKTHYVAAGSYAAKLSSDGAYYIVNVGKLK
ncbi:MAG: hypothetical protein JSS76_10840 [Bacteroidetes bacterium]|nr:hypothetical protein [Bacteroidota bacterium]